MAEPSSGGGGFFPLGLFGGLFGTTDFESKTHEEMLTMVAAANPETLKTLASQLTDASKTINEIGEDLKAYITSVPWEGEAGKAMETWGEGAWKATLQLGTYSAVGGTWLGNAAQTLTEVKQNLPKKDVTAQGNLDASRQYHNDPDSQKIGSEARAKLTEDHAQAVQQMNKLAQSYSFSTFLISAAEPPTFPPPPGEFVPGRQLDSAGDLSRSAGTESSVQRVASDDSRSSSPQRVVEGRETSTTTPREVAVTERPVGEQPVAERPVTERPVAEQPVQLETDSVGTLPPQTQIPPAPTTVPPPGGPDAPNTVLPGTIPPTFSGKNAVVPTAGGPGGRTLPGAPGTAPPGQAGSRMPRESGIVGGRPVTPNTGRPAGGLPRGMVIGSEAGAGARGTMGRGMAGMPGGGPMGGAGQSGISGGRRLASEAGGMVGGRPQQSGQSGARPFTPGGSGLVRGANPGAGAGRAGAGSPGRRGVNSRQDEQNGERPDYLTEDEETWQQSRRHIVPPVID
ncbi:WXG100 family type VII secretion target [Streptomyces sp. NPDC052236]|uniref:WXG100 family type VII secretion target n=1 Tax=Streptomyces sp. NPDC052236 TaxID=3365686 RepID=UPI0037D964D8